MVGWCGWLAGWLFFFIMLTLLSMWVLVLVLSLLLMDGGGGGSGDCCRCCCCCSCCYLLTFTPLGARKGMRLSPGVGFGRVGCPASGRGPVFFWRREGSSQNAVIYGVFWFTMLSKRQTAVVFTAFSASVQSCLTRAQKGTRSSRGVAAVVCIRLCRDRKRALRVTFCASVFLRKSNPGAISVTRSLSWAQSIHGQSRMTSMVYCDLGTAEHPWPKLDGC